MSNHLLVRNMVCNRCIHAVEDILRKLNIEYSAVMLGEVQLKNEIDDKAKYALETSLNEIGFDLIDDQKTALIEKAKQLIISKARNETELKDKKLRLSSYLQDKLAIDYTYLSNLFSSVEGRTIENYFIAQRIEKAKELLVYAELTLSEIAFELDYSSVAHLSAQFKKVTGLTPGYFRSIGSKMRKSVDNV